MDMLVILVGILINLSIAGFVLFKLGDMWKKQLKLEHEMPQVIEAISKLQSTTIKDEEPVKTSEDLSNDQMIDKLTQAGILDSVIPATYE